MSEEKPSPKPARDPQALSSEYHKARKQLMLWTAILFIWELIGIDLDKAKDSGGNVGAIIAAIKNPQAVPWVLLILVGYFAFKLRVEWRQCNKGRREVVEAKQDYYSAWVFAIAAYILYLVQTVSRANVADLISAPSTRFPFAIGLVFANMPGNMLARLFLAWRSPNDSVSHYLNAHKGLAISGLIFSTLVLVVGFTGWGLGYPLARRPLLIGMTVGFVGQFLTHLAIGGRVSALFDSVLPKQP